MVTFKLRCGVSALEISVIQNPTNSAVLLLGNQCMHFLDVVRRFAGCTVTNPNRGEYRGNRAYRLDPGSPVAGPEALPPVLIEECNNQLMCSKQNGDAHQSNHRTFNEFHIFSKLSKEYRNMVNASPPPASACTASTTGGSGTNGANVSGTRGATGGIVVSNRNTRIATSAETGGSVRDFLS